VIRRRAHMVRGHWRDNYRLPKGNKSIWVTEHPASDRFPKPAGMMRNGDPIHRGY
jgi:hypothetical protein